jgi:hypothetical protein
MSDEHSENEIRHLSKKELIREQRKAAYKKASAKAKERRAEQKARAKDPSTKEYAIKQEQKERARKLRKAAYEAAKARQKAKTAQIRDNEKKDQRSFDEGERKERDEALFASLRPASEIKPQLRLVKGGQSNEEDT